MLEILKENITKSVQNMKSQMRRWKSRKRITWNLRKLLTLESVRKLPPVENPHHAETSQSTRNANKLTGCNKTLAQNQRRLQDRLGYHKYLR